MAKYVWREQVIARTSGFCLLCTDIISKGTEMVVLGTGPRGGRDWDRAHVECAMESPEVLDVPQQGAAQPEGPVLTIPSLESADGYGNARGMRPSVYSEDDAVRPAITIRELTVYTQGQKYEVLANGVPVRRFSDRRRAEGAAEMLQHLNPIS